MKIVTGLEGAVASWLDARGSARKKDAVVFMNGR